MKTVAIIEDQTALRDLVGQIFDRRNDFEIVIKSGDGQDAIDQCLEKRPTFIILDVMLPGLNGVEVLRCISKKLPDTKVLIFSAFYNASVIRDLLQNGAHGIVEKTAPLAELIKGIEAVSDGGSFFGPEIARLLRETLIHPEKQEAPLACLTTRERQIVQLIAESYSTKEIASRLDISVKTAENHRTNLMRKLNLHDVAGLTRFAISNGLTSADPTFNQDTK